MLLVGCPASKTTNKFSLHCPMGPSDKKWKKISFDFDVGITDDPVEIQVLHMESKY